MGYVALQRWRAALPKLLLLLLFYSAASTTSSTYEKEKEKKSEKEKERKSFETCLVSLFPASLLLVLFQS
jgi:hypothetical protein